MPPPLIRSVPKRVELQRPVYAYPERTEDGPDGEGTQIPAGEYVVQAQYRVEALRHDPEHSDGYYYLLQGDGVSGYVWQDELHGGMRGRW